MIKSLVKNLIYLVVGLLAIFASGLIAEFLNGYLRGDPSTFTIVISWIFAAFICHWVGKMIIEKD